MTNLDVRPRAGSTQEREHVVDRPVLRVDGLVDHHVAEGVSEARASVSADARGGTDEPGTRGRDDADSEQPRIRQDRQQVFGEMVEHWRQSP